MDLQWIIVVGCYPLFYCATNHDLGNNYEPRLNHAQPLITIINPNKSWVLIIISHDAPFFSTTITTGGLCWPLLLTPSEDRTPGPPRGRRFRAYISVLVLVLVLIEDSAGATGPGYFVRAVGTVAKVVVPEWLSLVVLEKLCSTCNENHIATHKYPCSNWYVCRCM